MQDKSHNNLIAITIGFFLILIIAILTYYRSSTAENDSNPTYTTNTDAVSENLKKATKITEEELAKNIRNKEGNLLLIDIRDEESFAAEHMLESKNIPLPRLSDALGALDRSKVPVLIDFGHALESTALAASILADAGFTNVYYLYGGFTQWKNKYNPTISSGDPNSFTDQSKINYIQSDKLKELIATDEDLAIIDVRRSNQFTEGHIEGASNIFLDDLESKKEELPLGKKIILYDNDGLWAFKAAVRLFDMGYFNTFALSDGLDNWKNKKFEIVK